MEKLIIKQALYILQSEQNQKENSICLSTDRKGKLFTFSKALCVQITVEYKCLVQLSDFVFCLER